MKKFGAMGLIAVLAAVLVAPSVALADDSATSGPITYKAAIGYDFEKLSHPAVGTSQPDGIVDYQGAGSVAVPGAAGNLVDNAGDRGQSYSWSAASYGDWLYVGTCYAAMGNTLSLMKSALGDSFDADVMEASLKAMFNGTFFYGQEDGVDSKGILVKVNTKTGETKLLMSNSLNNIAPLFRNAVSYNGKLYFCGSVNENGRGGLPSVYEIDPANNDEYKVVYQGLSSMQDYGMAYKLGISTGIRGMCVYDGQLVISNVGKDASGNFVATILASSNPSEGFTQIASSADLFNYPAIRYKDSIYGGAIWDMVEYNGRLYVSICTGTPENAPDDNSMRSFALVRGEKNADGTFTWTPVAGDKDNDGARYTFGIDPERTRSGAANLVVYNGHLYIGEYNDEEIALERILFDKSQGGDSSLTSGLGGVDCSFVNANLEQSVNLYRMDENEDVCMVVGDPTEMFPEGGISGLGSGFGHNENQYIWRMQVFDGKLYVGTFDTSSLLQPIGQFSNGDIIAMTPEQWKSQLKHIRDLIEQLLKKRPVVDGAQAAPADEGGYAQPDQALDGSSDALDAVDAGDGEAVATADEGSSDAGFVSEAEGVFDAVVDEAAVARAAVLANNATAGDFALADGFESLNDALDGATDLMGDQTMALADGDDDAAYAAKIEAETQYFQAFYDTYSAALDEYENLQAQYEALYGEPLPQEVKDAYESLLNNDTLKKLKSVITCMGYLKNATRGFDMYVMTVDSNQREHFTTLTTNGFNDPYNHGLRVFAVTNQGLCLGTANPFYGTQLWIQRKEVTPTPSDPSEPSAPSDPSGPATEPTEPKNPGSSSSTGASVESGVLQQSASASNYPGTPGSIAETGDGTMAAALAAIMAGMLALGWGLTALRRRKSQ